MTSLPQRDALKRFYTTYGIAAILVYGFLMLAAFPWWHTANRPVALTFGVDDDTRIRLVYSENEEGLILTPTGELTPFHWNWATELPPRRSYSLALEFPNGTNGEAILKDVAILDLHDRDADISLDLTGLEEAPQTDIRIRKLGDGWGILARPGGRIELPGKFPDYLFPDWFRHWIGATWGYLLFAGMGILLLATALRFPHTIAPRKRLVPLYETAALIAGALAGAAVHLHLLKHALPGYTAGNSTAYLMEALVGAPGSSLPAEALQFFAYPSLFYPLFLRFGLEFLNGDINKLILVQGVFYSISVFLLALSFRRLVHGTLLGIAVFLILISPAAVWASRHIDQLSLSASFSCLALGAFMYLWQRAGALRLAGWVLFGLAVTGAVCTHVSGLVLLALPGFLFIGGLWWSYSNRGGRFWKIPVFWHTSGQVAIPVVMVLGTLTAMNLAIRDHSSFGCRNGLAGMHRANAPFSSGFLDITALGGEDQYRGLVRARDEHAYSFNAWSLRQELWSSIDEAVKLRPLECIAALDQGIEEFNESTRSQLPFTVRLAVMGRISLWALTMPERPAYSLEPIIPSYMVPHSFRDMNTESVVRRELSLVASGTDLPLRLTKARSDQWVYLYNRSLVVLYPWVYRILLIAGLVGWFFAVSERKYAAAACIGLFPLLVVYHMIQMHILGAELQALEAILWMGTFAGLTAVMKNTLQMETAEDDRRCLPPVKPKRLLTRHTHKPDEFIL